MFPKKSVKLRYEHVRSIYSVEKLHPFLHINAPLQEKERATFKSPSVSKTPSIFRLYLLSNFFLNEYLQFLTELIFYSIKRVFNIFILNTLTQFINSINPHNFL